MTTVHLDDDATSSGYQAGKAVSEPNALLKASPLAPSPETPDDGLSSSDFKSFLKAVMDILVVSIGFMIDAYDLVRGFFFVCAHTAGVPVVVREIWLLLFFQPHRFY